MSVDKLKKSYRDAGLGFRIHFVGPLALQALNMTALNAHEIVLIRTLVTVLRHWMQIVFVITLTASFIVARDTVGVMDMQIHRVTDASDATRVPSLITLTNLRKHTVPMRPAVRVTDRHVANP